MSEETTPIKSVDEARQFAAKIDANPCIPQALHHALSQIGIVDAVKAAIGKDDDHLRDAMDARLNDADYALYHQKSLASVDASLPESDRKAIDQIREEAGKKLLAASHPFDDAAMPPAPKSCRGR